MKSTEKYLKAQEIVISMRDVYENKLSVMKIAKNGDGKYQYSSSHNKALSTILENREEIARRYFEESDTEEAKNDCINIFSQYNHEIIKILGLYTF